MAGGARGGKGGAAAGRPGMVQGSRERRPPPWVGWAGQGLGQLAVRACVCVCEPVPRTQAGPSASLPSPSWPVGDTPCDLLWPEGAGASVSLPFPFPSPLAACVCLTAFGLQATTKEVKEFPGEAVVSALGQKEAEMDS